MEPYTRLTLIAFLLFMARGMTGPISSIYIRSLGASYLVIGLLGTVTSVTTIGASYLWGRASDRLGRRRDFLIGGLAALATCLVALALVPGYLWLFPIYVLMAMAQSAYDMGSLALMGDWLEVRGRQRVGGDRPDRGRRMGTYRGLASLGFGLMAFISGSIADRLSLRAPFGLAAGFFTLACLLALGSREPPSEAPSNEPSSVEGASVEASSVKASTEASSSEASSGSDAADIEGPSDAASRQSSPSGPEPLPLPPLLVAALLWSLVVGAVYAVWGNYMVEALDYTPAQMTRLWALASLSEFPLMMLAGWLSDRIGRLPMLSLGFATWGLVFVGYLVAPYMPWIVLVQLTRGFAYSAHTATAMTYAAEVRARSERGRISGLYGTAGAFGSILGSSLGGALTQYVGFRALIGAGAAIIFVGAIYLGGAAWRHHQRPALLQKEP
jgi:MFS family permease